MRITTLPNNRIGRKPTPFTDLLTTALASVFIVAGIFKWADPIAFQVSIVHLDLFPDRLVMPFVDGIPVIEILLGLICFSENLRETAYRLLFLLTTAYTALLVVECLRGISPGCGCFGAQSAQWPYWALFTRNLGLLAIEYYLIRTDFFQSVTNIFSQRKPQLSQ